MTLRIRKPTEDEISRCEMIDVTADTPWHPSQLSEDDLTEVDYDSFVRKTTSEV
jgi:hypothetical protein